MIELLAAAAQAQSALHLAHGSSGGGGGGLLLLAGPVTGTGLYAAVYRFYRNADKTDQFEKETAVALKDPVTGQDAKVDEVKGTRNRRVEGDNSGDFRQRVTTLD